ncbi:MAG: UPF0158 family protein [Mangrovibacterium sp.]|nr:UPF0158 family protein [Mangrovibacterium sp.]
MNAKQLLDEILPILYTIKEDPVKLQKILTFLEDEIYEEPEEEEIQVPEKFKPVVSKIAESIDCGFVCFLNPDTLEIEEQQKMFIEDPEEYDEDTGESEESIESNYQSWKKCITFEPPEPFDSFKIMEHFVDKLNDTKLQDKLVNALNRKRPFTNFKFIIDRSPYRQDWFNFKRQWMENHVKGLLMLELQKEQKDDQVE